MALFQDLPDVEILSFKFHNSPGPSRDCMNTE